MARQHFSRIVQEAMTNAAKHSGTKSARVTLWSEGTDVRLSVEILVTDIQSFEAHGDSIEESLVCEAPARLLGIANFLIEKAKGGGTEILVTVPLSP